MNVDELKELQSRIIKKNKTCNLISIISLIVLLFITLFIFLEKELDLKFILFGLLFELIFGLVISTIIKVIINGKSISKFNKEYKNIFVSGSKVKIIEYYGKGGFDPLDSKNGYVHNVESVDYYE